jgi:hypothetical protein
MNNVNVKFTECVRFTHYASNSRVNVKQRVLTPINASNSRIAFKRTETGFLGVFPSMRYGHIKTLSKRLERASKAQETTNGQNADQQNRENETSREKQHRKQGKQALKGFKTIIVI